MRTRTPAEDVPYLPDLPAAPGAEWVMVDRWSCRHFSLSNPSGPDEENLPLLLRRLADQIEEQQIVSTDILDLTVSSEITANGPWWSATVYWSPSQTG